MESFKFLPKAKMDQLPKTTGVYAFKSVKDLIYIGKAINIQSRVKNHKDFFMPKVDKIGFIKTSSEIEALILEANLIKKYQPKYNVAWRDDKNYFYVAIQQAQGKPYIYITHQKNDGADYIGPFVDGTSLKKTLRFLRRAFPYYTSKKHPKLKCTYCHLDLCPGPTPNLVEYKKNIKKLILVLQGKRGKVLNSLRREMKQLSRDKQFEEAAKIRDRIHNLQQVMAHTQVINSPLRENYAIADFARKLNKIEAYDISNIQGKFATGSMVVFVNGKPDKSQYKKFKIKLGDKPNDIAMLKEVLTRRFSHKDWLLPDAILIDGGKAQLNVAISCKPKEVKVFSIAKGRQELFIEGRDKPIALKDLPQETKNLILQLDSEAHRFAISYHKKLRQKSLLG